MPVPSVDLPSDLSQPGRQPVRFRLQLLRFGHQLLDGRLIVPWMLTVQVLNIFALLMHK